jgi:hypothetical protein
VLALANIVVNICYVILVIFDWLTAHLTLLALQAGPYWMQLVNGAK